MHGLAANYHWTEEQIFSLPLVRLRAYQEEMLADQGARPQYDEDELPEMMDVQRIMVDRMHRQRG